MAHLNSPNLKTGIGKKDITVKDLSENGLSLNGWRFALMP